MVFNIFLFITFILQMFAAITALRLIRWTRLNVSWMLISLGLVTMAIKSTINIVGLFIPGFGFESDEPYSWGGFFVSFCFAIGVFMIRKIFVYLREAEEKQRAYEKQMLMTMIKAEENERKRFATELHDGLGPILSSIKMGFSAIKDDIKDDEIKHNLETAIAEAIVTVREVSNNLSPLVLNNFGIEKAVKNFMSKLIIPQEMNIDYEISIGETRYPATIEIVVYRVVCELINNTIKHSKATNVHFSINEKKGNIEIEYEDNGIGFDTSSIKFSSKAGYGYYNMISRVSSLKGTANFTKRQNGGMRAEIIVPNKD